MQHDKNGIVIPVPATPVPTSYEPSVDELVDYVPDLLELHIPELDKGDMRAVMYIDQPNALRIVNYGTMKDGVKKNQALFKLIANCVVRQDRSKVFATEADVKRLQRTKMAIFTRFANAFKAMSDELNIVDDDDDDGANDDLD